MIWPRTESINPIRPPSRTARLSEGRGHAQNASILAIVAPTRLSGVEAPDVRPTVTEPVGGSQPDVVTSAFEPTGRCRISSGEIRQSGLAMWKVRRDTAQMRARLQVLLLLYPPTT